MGALEQEQSSTGSAVPSLNPSRMPSAASVAAAALLARKLLRYVPPGEVRPLRALECAEAWVRAGAPASGYSAVERSRLAAAGCAAEADAQASCSPLGSAERLEANLLTQAALAARRACAGDGAGVQECIAACATLVATSGVYS